EERRPLKTRIRLLCGLFSAPLLATAFHFLLRISHMGAGYTWDNIRRTVHDRTLVGLSHFDFVRLLLRIREYLLRFDLIALSVLLVIVVHLAARLPLRRRLILLISALLGGVGFWVVFPATALLHYWMTYRHQMPFIIILLALVTEAGRTALKERARPASRIGAHPIAAYGLALACGCPLGWTAYRNLLDVRKGFELGRLRTPTAEANLATHYLDLAQWSSDFGRRGDERLLLLFDGRRADALKNPYLRYEFPIGISSHDELWWLEAVSIRSLQLLLEDATLDLFREHCSLSFFDGVSFRSVNDQASTSIESFVPTSQESPAPHYRWLRYSLATPVNARAVRISCANLPTNVPLHELEVH
ncbi:MAG TPA: hypothetical protein VKP30_15635, partial [Polyangiaceae bacterium]|nr:hypothetical protein [Polyangiaceae bacterium]